MTFHPSRPSPGPVLALALGLTLVACEGAPTEADSAEVPVMALSEAPTLQVGVLEGDENYTFQDLASVIRLASGNIVAADAGASEFLQYTPSGAFIRRMGGRGEGPGEFRNMIRLYPLGGDSLMALDGWVGRLSVFDTAGTFSHQLAMEDLASDTLFRMDVWLYGRFWVDGALDEGLRRSVRVALDRLPLPTGGPGYRFVRMAGNGDLWIREPAIDTNGARTWTIVDPLEGPKGLIRIPVRFDPQTLADREVLGRWLGDSDVHFVRAYGISNTGTRASLPAWLTSAAPTEPLDAPDQDAFMGQIRTAFRGLASAQEIHYSTAMTYTARLDSLKWAQPEDVVVDVINAGPRGWVAVFTHPALDRICALGYGYTVPPGWAPGGVLCGPPSARTVEGGN